MHLLNESQCIGRAADIYEMATNHMRVNLSGLHIIVAKQLL